MVSIKDSLDKLELYLLELEEKYIDTHDDPLEDPDKYKLDVRSYCVLSHAAFEEFVENICLYTLNEIEEHKDGYRQFVVENAYANEIKEFFDVVLLNKIPLYGFEQDLEILKLIDELENK